MAIRATLVTAATVLSVQWYIGVAFVPSAIGVGLGALIGIAYALLRKPPAPPSERKNPGKHNVEADSWRSMHRVVVVLSGQRTAASLRHAANKHQQSRCETSLFQQPITRNPVLLVRF